MKIFKAMQVASSQVDTNTNLAWVNNESNAPQSKDLSLSYQNTKAAQEHIMYKTNVVTERHQNIKRSLKIKYCSVGLDL